MNIIFSTSLLENERQEPACCSAHSPMALSILPSSVPDNGAWIQTTGLLSLASGSFWSHLAGATSDLSRTVSSPVRFFFCN